VSAYLKTQFVLHSKISVLRNAISWSGVAQTCTSEMPTDTQNAQINLYVQNIEIVTYIILVCNVITRLSEVSGTRLKKFK